MADAFDIDTNADEVADWLDEQLDEFQDTRPGMLTQAQNDTYKRARDKVPVDTGDLKDSLEKLGYGVGSDLHYAPHVGLGTIHMDGTDYLWGPAKKALKQALKDYAED